MKKFKIAEHFVSINGEGNRLGNWPISSDFRAATSPAAIATPIGSTSLTLRIPKCPQKRFSMRCGSAGVRNVTLTGGEPLLQENISSDRTPEYGRPDPRGN